MSLDSNSLAIVGLALGVVGIVVSVFLALRYAEKKKPTCYSETYLKIAASEDAPADIQIAYKGTPVERVSSTVVWFWNGGRRPIKRDDFPQTHPLRLRLSDHGGHSTILDFAVRKVSREAVNLAVAKEGEATLQMTFDFLDLDDGFVIEVQHTGSAWSSAELTGVILGAPKGIRLITQPASRRARGASYRAGVPSLYYESARRSKRKQFKHTAILTLLLASLGLLGVVLVSALSGRIEGKTTLSTKEIRGALATYLTGRQLDSAVIALKAADRETFDAKKLWIVAVVIWLFGLLVIWGPLHSFPDSLLLAEPPEPPTPAPT